MGKYKDKNGISIEKTAKTKAKIAEVWEDI